MEGVGAGKEVRWWGGREGLTEQVVEAVEDLQSGTITGAGSLGSLNDDSEGKLQHTLYTDRHLCSQP